MEKANVQAVIFDVDGLMFDTERVSGISWAYAAEVTGVVFPEGLLDEVVGRSFGDIERLFLEVFPEGTRVAELLEVCDVRYRALLEAGEFEVKAGFLALLEWVEGAGLPVALATSSTLEKTRVKLRAKGLEGRFSRIVTSEDVSRGKPAPDIFLRACEVLGVAPGGALVLEDSNPGVRGALAAGCGCFMVPDVVSAEEDVREGALGVVESLYEVLDWFVRRSEGGG